MNQSHSHTLWREPAGSGAVPTVQNFRLVLVSPGVYTFAATGTPGGSLVSDGAGGYVLTVGDFSGTGRVVFVRSVATVI